MDVLGSLQGLSRDADPSLEGFQARPLYLLVSVLLPVGVGALVGWGLRLIERVLGVELGRGGH